MKDHELRPVIIDEFRTKEGCMVRQIISTNVNVPNRYDEDVVLWTADELSLVAPATLEPYGTPKPGEVDAPFKYR